MVRLMLLPVIVMAAAVAAPTGRAALAQEAGDAARGEQLYRRCVQCHLLDPAAEHRLGPGLAGLFGARAGTRPGWEGRYSQALLESDVVWDAENLDAFLADYRSVIPGIQKRSPPLRRAQDRADLIAYLAVATILPEDGGTQGPAAEQAPTD